ncbi:hypothetical protein IWX90DRAFT_66841 [Phyllosticta citrichinensis]|uniref:JmjC domain-containing histone demethylation protein 1 n=1 Tax=Phyllosticta citrichinensis TaxID=1130410 RepID=A0ABR1XHV6_9PEZI
MKLRSFKQTPSDIPLPPRTPSPIHHLIEPLTPTYPTAHKDGLLSAARDPNAAASAAAKHTSTLVNGRGGQAKGLQRGHNNIERAAHQSRHAHTRQNRGSSHGSPIDALADVASSLASSPVFAQPATIALQPHASPRPTTRPFANGSRHIHTASDGQDYRYVQAQNYGYAHGNDLDERPSKRARSDAGDSHLFLQGTARPATSHNPSGNWPNGFGESVFGAGLAPYASPSVNNLELDVAQSLLQLRSSGSLDQCSSARKSMPALDNHSSRDGLANWHAASVHGLDPSMQSFRPDSGLIDGHQARHRHSIATYQPEPLLKGTDAIEATPSSQPPTKMQTHTPPEDVPDLANTNKTIENPPRAEGKKGKSHQGWPKGKPRGPRNKGATKKTAKVANKVTELAAVPPKEQGVDQLQSPQSLNEVPPGSASTERKEVPPPEQDQEIPHRPAPVQATISTAKRRNSFPDGHGSDTANPIKDKLPLDRAASVPPDNSMLIKASSSAEPEPLPRLAPAPVEEEVTICAGCNFSRGPSTGQNDQWIGCNGCQGWYHFACAGFRNAKEVSSVDKFYCRTCKPKFGSTTFVRKSKRAHTAVDYAGLNEGVLRTSEDEHEHHYIQPIKDGTFTFQPETFPRMRPELVTAEHFEKSGGFKEPIVIPACWNPQPNVPGTDTEMADAAPTAKDEKHDGFYDDVEYETAPDDGQDLLDMVIPADLTVRKVANLYGPEEKVEVIDVKSQEGEDKRWNMAKWADYYEDEGEKPVRNVISLEFSHSRLGRLVRRPKVVRDLDLQDAVWPQDETAQGNFPKVQFYCLMSVADCYTDFHIDFGGSSVFYHIIKGKKTFFFIPPKKQHLKKYEEWCLSPAQNFTFLAHETKECYRVDLSEGDTMLIPSGWIHAVWTPANSLVIGGNFLTRLNYGMQIRVAEVEKNTKVARKFRYPSFQKVLWYAVLHYLQDDPLPPSVSQQFSEGKQFSRSIPIYLELDKFGHNSDPGPENYNARYYSQSELEGLPDLVSYIFRTVMISQGCLEGITQEVRNAVTRSIPKGHGKPLEIIKTFAMWTAWKRGNEDIPTWAHPDAELPDTGVPGEKKLSNAALKRLERKAFIENYRAAAPERAQSARLRTKALEGDSAEAISLVKHTSSPKTSVLGPKRIACDACRRRRIRCKHKDEVSSPISPQANASGERRPSAPIVAVMMPSPLNPEAVSPLNGIHPQIANGHLPAAVVSDVPQSAEIPEMRRRSKACLDCRRSKRRCIHDEHGNVDPVKAQEQPVPRGRRRVSGGDEADGLKTSRLDSGLNFGQQGPYPPPEQDFVPDHQEMMAPSAYPQLSAEESSDVLMVDAPSVEAQPEPQPPVDAMSSVIDPMLENYPQFGTIDEEVDQIQVNGAHPVELATTTEVQVPDSGDVALPSTESVHEVPVAPMAPMARMVVSPKQPSMIGGQPSQPVSPHGPNGVQQSSPLTELGNSMSPERPRMEMLIDPALDSPLERRQSLRTSRPVERYSETANSTRLSQPPKSRRTSSRTPAPAKSPSISGNSVKAPHTVTPARQRRNSNAVLEFVDKAPNSAAKTVSSEPKQRTLSQLESPDQNEASMRLIREMMAGDRGLRRRGSR